MKLDLQDMTHLLYGSSFFACGGGVPIKSSTELLATLDSGATVVLKTLEELEPDDLICTVYAIGAAGAARKNYPSLLMAFDALEMHLGRSIAGIVPGEIGSEINALWVAVQRNVALVDSDMVGGRAVPEEQMDIHSVQGITTAPTFAVNDKGDAILVMSSKNSHIMESVYRAFAVASGGYCYLAGRPMRSIEANKILPGDVLESW